MHKVSHVCLNFVHMTGLPPERLIAPPPPPPPELLPPVEPRAAAP